MIADGQRRSSTRRGGTWCSRASRWCSPCSRSTWSATGCRTRSTRRPAADTTVLRTNTSLRNKGGGQPHATVSADARPVAAHRVLRSRSLRAVEQLQQQQQQSAAAPARARAAASSLAGLANTKPERRPAEGRHAQRRLGRGLGAPRSGRVVLPDRLPGRLRDAAPLYSFTPTSNTPVPTWPRGRRRSAPTARR